MDELTRVLWEFAAACRLEGCYDLNMKKDREDGKTMAEWNLEHLKGTEIAAKELENLWEALELVRSVDMEAAFTCGFRLGLSLR